MQAFTQDVRFNGNSCEIYLQGRLNYHSIPEIWNNTLSEIKEKNPSRLILDVSEVDSCDASGIAYFLEHKRTQESRNGEFLLRGLREEFQYLYQISTSTQIKEDPEQKQFFEDLKEKPEEIGLFVVNRYDDAKNLIEYIGELTVSFWYSIFHPSVIRWRDVFRTAEHAGVNAFPIIAMIGFLLGLIMSFQSAIPMKKFGAEIFVANLIGLSLFRELGPLMTAFILAGRSGSAFAAELGTMKVSEEVDALSTMGLSPIQFLVVPRLLAAIIMTPLLTVVFNLLGLVGGAIVLMSFGFPLVTFINQVLSAVTIVDFAGGMVKAYVFGLVIAGIGCFEGLRTTTGAGAVGQSTTRAVVGGIIYVAILDGIFSIAYFYLGI
ncbi:MAG: MlaE family lipid ABC transporter permease subunit [Leptospira sp.]|nr:MlaE family lipid ABC transporter permease subunit [Leptospira sp.]